MVKYSEQANILIENLNKDVCFDKSDFEKWFIENNKVITYNIILEFLLIKKQIGLIELSKELMQVNIDRELIFDNSIKNIIEKLDINIELLKKFYIKNTSTIGDNAVLIYLNKEKIKENEFNQKKINGIMSFLIENFDVLKKFIEIMNKKENCGCNNELINKKEN